MASIVENLRKYVSQLNKEKFIVEDQILEILLSFQTEIDKVKQKISQKFEDLQPVERISGKFAKYSPSIKEIRQEYEEKMKKFNTENSKKK